MSVRIIPIVLLATVVVVVSGSLSVMSRPKVPEKQCKATCAFSNHLAKRRHPEAKTHTCKECCLGLGKKYIHGACSFGIRSAYRHCYCQKSTYNKVAKGKAKKQTAKAKKKPAAASSTSGSGEEEAAESTEAAAEAETPAEETPAEETPAEETPAAAEE